MLSQETKAVIRSTVPVLEVHGTAITSRFYQLLFEQHPELLNIFNQANQRQGRQQTALANAVYAAALHIDNLESILPTVKLISHKHRGLGIQPEHYPIVGENLLRAIKDVLGDAATDEILNAWGEAYGVIADAFISVEHQMYDEVAQTPGGWRGFRSFIVSRKVMESDVLTSFYLVPQDGGPIASFLPGQYLTIRVHIPGVPHTQLRHYSLSSRPGEPYYRLTVKREDARGDIPAGVVSTYLHQGVHEGDVIEASAPSGEFVFDTEASGPVVFLSGGVGMTPLVSMLSSVVDVDPNRDVTYIHAAINGHVHGLKQDVVKAIEENEQMRHHIVYERPTDEDKQNPYFAKEGFVDINWLKSVADQSATFYFCGPTPFMKAIYGALKEWGVPPKNIRYEFFGPQGALES